MRNGGSDVMEGYDEHAGEYTIDVHLENRLFGTLFAFTERISDHE